MGTTQSMLDCCTSRERDEFALQLADAPRPEQDTSQRASDAQAPGESMLPPSWQGALPEEDSFGRRIGALLTPGALSKPTVTTQVDTPKVQDYRLTQAEASDKATEPGCASSLQALPETPHWIADNAAPHAICMEASNSDPPPPPRPGFRATAADKEQTEADVVLTPSSRGVPDPPLSLIEEQAGVDAELTPSRTGAPRPPLALPEDVAEATTVLEATDMSEIEAARAAHFVEERGWGFSSLSSCHQESPATSARIHGPAKTRGRSVTGPLQRDLPRWSVNSEDSLVAKLAERMHRQRAGRVPDDQQQQQPQRRGPSEPQLEAKLADRMERQLFKEKTGVGSVALVRQNTWACDGGGIGFVDKALERRLEQQRLKAEGMRPQ